MATYFVPVGPNGRSTFGLGSPGSVVTMTVAGRPITPCECYTDCVNSCTLENYAGFCTDTLKGAYICICPEKTTHKVCVLFFMLVGIGLIVGSQTIQERKLNNTEYQALLISGILLMMVTAVAYTCFKKTYTCEQNKLNERKKLIDA